MFRKWSCVLGAAPSAIVASPCCSNGEPTPEGLEASEPQHPCRGQQCRSAALSVSQSAHSSDSLFVDDPLSETHRWRDCLHTEHRAGGIVIIVMLGKAAGTGRERTKKLTDGQAGRFSATRSDAGLRCALPFSARYARPLLPPVAMRVYRGLESAPGSAAW